MRRRSNCRSSFLASCPFLPVVIRIGLAATGTRKRPLPFARRQPPGRGDVIFASIEMHTWLAEGSARRQNRKPQCKLHTIDLPHCQIADPGAQLIVARVKVERGKRGDNVERAFRVPHFESAVTAAQIEDRGAVWCRG